MTWKRDGQLVYRLASNERNQMVNDMTIRVDAGFGTGRTPADAEVLAERIRAMLESASESATPTEERSCFTCGHNYDDGYGTYKCRNYRAVRGSGYWRASGCTDSTDRMPTNRTIPCPGWKAKESP